MPLRRSCRPACSLCARAPAHPLQPVLLPVPLAALPDPRTPETAGKAGEEGTGLLLQMKEHIHCDVHFSRP